MAKIGPKLKTQILQHSGKNLTRDLIKKIDS